MSQDRCSRCGTANPFGSMALRLVGWRRQAESCAKVDRELSERPWLQDAVLSGGRCLQCIRPAEENALWLGWLHRKPPTLPEGLGIPDYERVRGEARGMLQGKTGPTRKIPILGEPVSLFAFKGQIDAIAYKSVVLHLRPWLRVSYRSALAHKDRNVAFAVVMSGIGPDWLVDWTPGYGPPPTIGVA